MVREVGQREGQNYGPRAGVKALPPLVETPIGPRHSPYDTPGQRRFHRLAARRLLVKVSRADHPTDGASSPEPEASVR